MLMNALNRMVAERLAKDLGWFVAAACLMLLHGPSLWGLWGLLTLVIFWRYVVLDLRARAGLRRLSAESRDLRCRIASEPDLWINKREWDLLLLTS